MLMDDYKRAILLQLGAPFLDIELEQNGLSKLHIDEYDAQGSKQKTTDRRNFLTEIVETALLELREYIDTIYYRTVVVPPAASSGANMGNRVDLSKTDVRAVIYVTRADVSSINSTGAIGYYDPFVYTPIASNASFGASSCGFGANSMQDMLSDLSAMLQVRQIQNTFAADLDFVFSRPDQQLYIYQQLPASSTITIAYNKLYQNVEEIEEHYWQNLMIRLGLAYAKISLGRIRSKYAMASAPYELDGAALLAEGNEELATLRQFLSDNNNIYIPGN